MKEQKWYSGNGFAKEAAKEAGAARPVSTQTLRRHDNVLHPPRLENGQRIYPAEKLRLASVVLYPKK